MRTHRFDPLSFVFGAVFVALAVLALTDAVVLGVQDLRWIGPGVLVVIGLVLLATAGRGDKREAVVATAAAGVTDAAPDVAPAAPPAAGSAPDPSRDASATPSASHGDVVDDATSGRASADEASDDTVR